MRRRKGERTYGPGMFIIGTGNVYAADIYEVLDSDHRVIRAVVRPTMFVAAKTPVNLPIWTTCASSLQPI